MLSAAEHRRHWESLDRSALEQHQLARLNALLESILPQNRFYAEKLSSAPLPVTSLAQLTDWNYTFKDELVEATHEPGFAANLTWPRQAYSRFHQTSGTRGRPMAVLDTPADWRWWLDCWQYVLDMAGVTAEDRAFFAFSFGPFIGFWSAYDAVAARGATVVPGGGLTSLARLDLLERTEATLLFCTPTYALHIAEVAAANDRDVSRSGIRALLLAGEPGGSVPAVRKCLEDFWQAQVIDHAGATEIGAWGYGTVAGGGLYVNEAEFLAEFISVETGEPAVENELSELVLTTLGRAGSPVIRYRTGDLVRPVWSRPGPNRFVFLDGGVLGRADDMLVIRGVNVFPSSIDQIVRGFPEIVEYRMTATTIAAMDVLSLEVEDRLNQPERVAEELQLRLGLRVHVEVVPPGTLPRYEGKSRRFIDQRIRNS